MTQTDLIPHFQDLPHHQLLRTIELLFHLEVPLIQVLLLRVHLLFFAFDEIIFKVHLLLEELLLCFDDFR